MAKHLPAPDAPTSNSQIAALLGIDDGEQGDPVSAAFNRGHEADAQERQDISIELADPNNAEAQEAWNGVVQRINEDAAYMVAQQREQTKKMQHTDGSLRPAILKEKDSDGNDQQVYIVDGNVQMMPDGSVVDKASSDNIVVIYNPATDERKQIDPSADTGISSLGEVTTAEQREADIERSRQEYVQAQIDEAQGTVRLSPGQQLVLPTGEEAVVVATDADGGNITVALGDGTQATVQRSELQRIRDEKGLADYRKRHGITEEPAAQQPEASMPAQLQADGRVACAPADYTADMELTIRDEDGIEKPAMVMGRVRYENGSFVPDANGNIIEYFMDGEVKHDHEDKLVDKVVSHVAPAKPEADIAPTATEPQPQQADEERVIREGIAGVGEGLRDAVNEQAARVRENDINNWLQKPTVADAMRKYGEGAQSVEEVVQRALADNPNDETKAALGDIMRFDSSKQLVQGYISQPQPAKPAEAHVQSTEQQEAEPMPVGEDGEEDWHATTPERAHTYIFNEAGLTRSEGNEFIAAQIQAAQTALSKASSANLPKIGTSIDKYNEAKAKRQGKIDEAQRVLDYWNGVREIQNAIQREENERRAADDAVRHDEAVAAAQAEYEARKQAEEERKAVGNENPMPAITEKWNNATKVDGHSDEIMLPDGTPLKGHYVLHESGASSPSHNSETWQKTDGFPMDSNDNSVNDRDYERDHDAQEHTQSIARQYDQRALQSVPVVSNDGVVLSGNGRTMAGQLAARDNTDSAYVNYLKEYAPKFGFTPEQVEAMQHPRVSFVPDEAMPYTAETFAKFNQQDMKSQNKTEQAVKLGKTVGDDVFKRIVRTINGYKTLGDFYNDDNASLGAVYDLHRAGVIPQAQLAEMVDGVRGQEKLSAIGREFLENMLIGKAFAANPDVVRMLTSEPFMRKAIITALGEIADNIAIGRGYSLQQELADAVKLCFDARKEGAKQGDIVSIYAKQGVLFADPDQLQTVADFNNAIMLMLADALNDKRVTILKITIQLYNNDARESAAGQTDLFAGGIRSREAILRDVINFIRKNYGKGKEIEAARAAAVERRKAESIQQNGTDEAGIGGSENTGGSGRNETAVSAGLRITDPRTMSDEERQRRGEMLRNATAIDVEPNHIVSTKDKTARKAAEEWWDDNVGDAQWYETEAGEVEINRNSIESSLAHGYGQMKLDAITSLIDGFSNAVYLGTMPDSTRQDGVLNHYFAYPINYKGKRSYVFCRALHDNNTNRLYVHEVFVEDKIKKGNTLQTAASQPHGGISLYRDILANVLLSDGKESENPASDQAKGEKVAENQSSSGVQAALEAAEQETNTEPTEAQKKAGNYKMGHVRIDGFDVTIENPKGSVRRGTDASGKQWEQEMQNTYGYIRGTEGVDGDHIDVFFSEDPSQGDVFIVDQVNKDGSFDEHKVMYGFPDIESARKAYLANHEDGWTGLGAITPVSKEEFKKWVQSSRRKTKPFSEYSSVKPLGDTQLGEQPTAGSFGPIYTQFKGRAREAIAFLLEKKDGEAIAALHHKDIGDIDLVWGKEGTGKSDGYGLAKLTKYHPEVLDNLQELLDEMVVTNRSENRVQLESETHQASVRLTWDNEKKNWLLTAFEKKNSALDNTTDTGKTSERGKRNDTATPQSTVSEGKGKGNSSTSQAKGEKVAENQVASGVEGAMAIVVEDVMSFPKEIREEATISKEQNSGKRGDRIKVKAGLSGNDLYIQYKSGRSSKDKRRWATIKIPNATNYSAGQIIYRLGYIGTFTDIERLSGDAVLELFNKNGLRLHKGGWKEVSPREDALRDALVDVLRGAGVDVVTDVEEGQRVLDEANGETRLQAKKRALETASLSEGSERSLTVVSSADGAKVLRNLDKAIQTLESSPTQPKTFVGDIANSLGAQRKGSKSEYATFETKNGRVVTIRLADHNATVSNFDRRGELDGISIVVSPKKSAGVTNDGEAHVVEYYYDAIKLRRADGKPLADIVRSIKQALYSGEFEDTTGLAERQEVNTDKVRFFRTTDGHAYGFTKDGKIYIDPRIATAETPIHEYSHLWAWAFRKANPKEWANIVELMKGTTLWEEVKQRYPELKTEDEIADEVLAHYSGRRGSERLRAERERIASGEGDVVEKAKAISALERVKDALNRFWKGVADWLGIHFTSAEEVADKVLADMLHGVNPVAEAGAQREGVRYEANSEEAEIVAKAKADGTYMKAPNGKPSRLSPRQWVQVRTRAFKEWFGDWELASKVLKVVPALKEHGFKNFDEARAWAKEHIVRTLTDAETGGKGEIRVSNNAVAKFLSESAVAKSDSKDVHLSVLKVLPEVIRESIDAEQHPDYKKGEDGSRSSENGVNEHVTIHRLYGAVNIDGKTYRVKVTLKEYADGNRPQKAYSYEATKIELLAGTLVGGKSSNPSTSNSITAAKLLENVEKSYGNGEKLLDYSKVVDENGEPLVVYHQTNSTIFVNRETGENFDNLNWKEKDYWKNEASEEEWNDTWEERDFYVFDNKTHGRRSVEMPAFFFSPVYDEYHEYGDRTVAAFLNIRNPIVNPDIPNRGVTDTAGEDAMNALIAQGYDGFIREYDGELDEINAFFPTQIKSADENVGTFDGSNPDIRYQFVGEKGAASMDKAEEASVRLDNLAVAREMEAAGKDAKTVKLATGWERGGDGKWRYEIEDGRFDRLGELHPERRRLSAAEQKELDEAFSETDDAFEKGVLAYKEEITKDTDMADIYEAGGMERKKAERIRDLEDKERRLKGEPKKLDDYLENDELFNAYPQLRDIVIDTSSEGDAVFGKMGSYVHASNTIRLNDTSLSTLTHEVQHAIQKIEGFARGGSVRDVRNRIRQRIAELDNVSEHAKEMLARQVEYRALASKLGRAYEMLMKNGEDWAVRAASDNYWEAMNTLDNDENSRLNNVYPKGKNASEIAKDGFNRDKAIEELNRLSDYYASQISAEDMKDIKESEALSGKINGKSDEELYHALGGEVEARNVQSRLSMTSEERRASLASETEDVAREDQIFLNDGLGVSMSESASETDLEDVNRRFNAELGRLTEENKDKVVLSLGRPSAVLLSAGVEDKPMKLYGNKVMKKMRKHGFALDELKNLPRAVADPIAVFDNYQLDGNRTVLTELQSKGKNIMIAVTLGKDGVDVDFNIVSSVFGKGEDNIVDWLNKGYARYINKEKALNYLHHSDRHISEALSNPRLVSAAKVVEGFENPKVSDENVSEDTAKYRIREDEPPTKTGIGYKVFVLKDGKLYPPMIANPGGEATPVGIWLDADAAPVVGVTKTGRQQVKAGGKGTQGGSGKLSYRPGWHLGEIPYALQFNRLNPETGEKELFPANFVWAEVEYANDVDYQDEAMSYGMTASGKFKHSLAGLPRLPENGSYRYRTNPNPETDPWVITGAMKVNRILKPSEVDAIVEAAGREPQQRQAGAITDEQVEALNATVKRTMQEDRDMMRSVAEQMGEKLHTDIHIIEDVNEITHPNAEIQEQRRRAKGWYDKVTRKVYVVLPNNRDVDDAKATTAHETIAHKGLRELIGEENYDAFLDEVYEHLRGDLKQQVDTQASRAFIDDATRNGERAKSYEQHRRTAVDELFGRLAEKPFEEFAEGERTLWQKIKATVRKVLDEFLGTLKLPKWFELGDNELRYILWRSKERMERGREHPIDLARDIVKREELGLTDEARYNMGDVAEPSFASRRDRAVKEHGYVHPGLNTAEVKVVPIKEKSPFDTSKKTKPLKEDVVAYANEHGIIGTMTEEETKGKGKVTISKASIEKMVDDSATGKSVDKDTHLAIIPQLREVIAESFMAETHPDYNKGRDGKRSAENGYNPDNLIHRCYGAISVDGQEYRVKLTLKENPSQTSRKAYTYEVTKIELLDSTDGERTGLSSSYQSNSNGVGSHPQSEIGSSYPLAKLLQNVGKSYEKGKNLLDESKLADESADLYREVGETDDIWSDGSLGLHERMTAAAARLSANHKDNKTLRNDAMRAIGSNLFDLRKAMSLQRTFDKITAKRVADLARVLMNSGHLSGLTQQEVKRLMAAIRDSVGRENIDESIQKIMDIMVDNQLKHAEATLHELESIKGSKVDARGVEVQGQLDPDGQTLIKAMKEAQKIVNPCGGKTHDEKGEPTAWGNALESAQMRMSSKTISLMESG